VPTGVPAGERGELSAELLSLFVAAAALVSAFIIEIKLSMFRIDLGVEESVGNPGSSQGSTISKPFIGFILTCSSLSARSLTRHRTQDTYVRTKYGLVANEPNFGLMDLLRKEQQKESLLPG